MNIAVQFLDPSFLAGVFGAIAVAATVLTVMGGAVESDKLKRRMKMVGEEREALRRVQRQEMQGEASGTLRTKTTGMIPRIVESFNLRRHLEDENTKQILQRAGLRGDKALYAFVFFRAVAPIALFVLALFYFFVIGVMPDRPAFFRFSVCVLSALLGYYVPGIYVKNLTSKRQTEIKRAFPDSLDLLLICVESGMSIEQAMRKVAEEIGTRSVALAEEFTLTNAELSYLQDRRLAYENFGNRTGLDGIKAVMTALVQAERYGTPLAHALRVMAQENRDMRMAEAEKKAAALPPKLTVPMITFFLPVLFVVIMGPAVIQLMAL
ncbi:MAG: type II secretion system F family protein [Pseudomonadota bacterium]